MNRIEALPRRNWRETVDVEAMTALYRTPNGTQTLRPIQAASLSEAPEVGGLFLHGRVGCGKRLTAGLLATAMRAERPLLLVPGSEVKDAEAAYKSLRKHWKIPRTLRIRSYSFISHPTREDWLNRHPPDLIICDEGHALKDLGSSCTIRVMKYLRENPLVRFCVMSGTLSPHGDLKDYAHLMLAALRRRAPIPLDARGINQWRRALEGTSDPSCILGAQDTTEALRLYAERLASTPGVIISVDSFEGVPLDVTYTLRDAPEATREIYLKLREFWEASDGWSYGDDTFQVAEASRQYAQGFGYRHDPRPPEEFLKIRKAWTGACRMSVENGEASSEGHLKLLIEKASSEGEGHPLEGVLAAWLEAKEGFPLRTVADWFALDALLYAKEWAKPHGIIWVRHIEVGEALEEITGLPFFRGQSGRNILHEDGSRCIIASIDHAGTGKNLQGPFVRGERAGPFYHNLILDPLANGAGTEQLLGRTHRELQVHPVTAEFYISCREQRQAVIKSIQAAAKLTATLSPQKMANEPYPPNSTQRHPAWSKSQRTTT